MEIVQTPLAKTNLNDSIESSIIYLCIHFFEYEYVV